MTQLLITLMLAAGAIARADLPPNNPEVLKQEWPAVSDLLEEHPPERTDELRQMVWATPLGLLVKDYLFAPQDPKQVTARARRIAHRMFSSGPLARGRRAALVMMEEDLYERGLVDTRVELRLSQLRSNLIVRKQEVEERSSDRMAYQLAIPALIGAMYGVMPLRRFGLESASQVLKRASTWRSEERALAMLELASDLEHEGAALAGQGIKKRMVMKGAATATGIYYVGHNFISTGEGGEGHLLRRYINKGLQIFTSIEYL